MFTSAEGAAYFTAALLLAGWLVVGALVVWAVRGRRPRVLVAAVVVLAPTALFLASRHPEQDRADDIAAVSDGVYAALGTTDRRVAYGYDVDQRDTGCGEALGLAPDQAWSASQAFALSPGTYDDDALIETAARHFAAEGYETAFVDRLPSSARSTRLRGLRAVKGDIAVQVDVPPLSVSIAAGPCARYRYAPDSTG